MSLADIVERFPGTSVLVVGDAMNDVYVFGRVERVSPEAPVPVFLPERTERRSGGAAHVLDQLGAYQMPGMLKCGPRSIKTRYMVGHHLLHRVDEDKFGVPVNGEIMDTQQTILDTPDLKAIVLSDYAKGWLSPRMCQGVIEVARSRHIPVIVDPKGHKWERYDRATVVCPNEREYHEWLDDYTEEGLSEKVRFALLEKRGALGIRLHGDPNGDFPARAQHVFDVTGAGDTVVATVAATLAVNGSLRDAARLAVLAAGVTVGEVGTAVCGWTRLMELAIEADRGG